MTHHPPSQVQVSLIDGSGCSQICRGMFLGENNSFHEDFLFLCVVYWRDQVTKSYRKDKMGSDEVK